MTAPSIGRRLRRVLGKSCCYLGAYLFTLGARLGGATRAKLLYPNAAAWANPHLEELTDHLTTGAHDGTRHT